MDNFTSNVICNFSLFNPLYYFTIDIIFIRLTIKQSKIMKKYIFSALLATGLLFASCGDDASDCTQSEFTNELNSAISALNTAGAAWASDPTNSNLCDNYVDAANNYLDAVEGFKGCDVISQSDYEQQIDAARDAINSLPGC